MQNLIEIGFFIFSAGFGCAAVVITLVDVAKEKRNLNKIKSEN